MPFIPALKGRAFWHGYVNFHCRRVGGGDSCGLLIGEDAYFVARALIHELSGKNHIVLVGQL